MVRSLTPTLETPSAVPEAASIEVTKRPADQADGWVARVLVVQLAVAGLGASLAASTDALELAARAAGALAAAAAIVLVLSRSAALGAPANFGLIAPAGGVGAFPSPDADALLYGGSLILAVLAAPRVLAEAREALMLSLGNGPAITTDALGRREVARARRVNRPLTIASVSWPGRRRRFMAAGQEVRALLRHTDVMGYAGSQRLFLFFIDTPPADATQAWRRIEARLQPGSTEGMRIGFASFPEDNPTWEGLKAQALDAERRHLTADHQVIPAAAAAMAEGA
jgi:hypothetical protein